MQNKSMLVSYARAIERGERTKTGGESRGKGEGVESSYLGNFDKRDI